MDWYELKVEVQRQLVESATNAFYDMGLTQIAMSGPALFHDAVDSRPLDLFDLEGEEFAGDHNAYKTVISAYVPKDGREEQVVEGLRSALKANLLPCCLTVKTVNGDDWGSAWKTYYRPEKVGVKTVIVPSWEKYNAEDGDVIVKLDPGEAFGTGQHGTTKGAVLALEKHISPGCSVLDVGTGSGILSIIASKLGAGRVLGVDLDSVAVEVANENVEFNGCAGCVEIRQGNLVEGVDGRFDVVVANILKEVISLLLPNLNRVLAPNGKFISAGFVTKFEHEVLDALKAHGHRVVERYVVEDWVTLVSEEVQCTDFSLNLKI